jgi:hypothetical protein
MGRARSFTSLPSEFTIATYLVSVQNCSDMELNLKRVSDCVVAMPYFTGCARPLVHRPNSGLQSNLASPQKSLWRNVTLAVLTTIGIQA